MVTIVRVPASAVCRRLPGGSVLAQLISMLTPRRAVAGRADRERHRRMRRERIEHERRSARAELAMLYLGVRR